LDLATCSSEGQNELIWPRDGSTAKSVTELEKRIEEVFNIIFVV
jgi:hypothetical protein